MSPLMLQPSQCSPRILLGALLQVLLAAISLLAESPPSSEGGEAFFETRIRPALVQHCYRCHSVNAKKSEGGLLLDSRVAIRKGGDRGPAVVPGKPKESWLLIAISHDDADLKMPPKKERLPKELISNFKTWIESGAADPRDQASGAFGPIDLTTARKFWSYQKPQPHEPPKTKDPSWTRVKLDHFILARLETAGLTPTPDADPAVLARRLHFDLVGLPPSPSAVRRFVERTARQGLDQTLAEEIDLLLASPRYGEHWGRHWLDVARFAESSGKEANMSFPYAWRYRDYVIDAFNQDLPFQRFIAEQMAGDLLPAESDQERARLLIATGFLALGPKNLDEADPNQFTADVIDEQIDAVTRAFLGSSVACARCHDHKFDPFSMPDYYALAGVFASSKTFFGTFVTPVNRIGGDPLPLPRGAGAPVLHAGHTPAHVAHLKQELAKLRQQQADGMAAVMKAAAQGEDTEKVFSLRDALRIFWTSGGIEGQLEKVDDQGRPLPLAMGVLDAEKIVDSPLLERGDIKHPGAIQPRGFPRVFEHSSSHLVTASHSGRLELAEWLADPNHPLTARVLVNRVWRQLFGAGLVSTVDNFGVSGSSPSHPDLLDDLSVQFVTEGWSIKKLVRSIALSRTYRQGSTYRKDAFQQDPDNRLLWRASKRRLTAEAIRDAMLAASDELDLSRPVGSLVGKEIGDRPISLLGLDPKIPADLDGSRHRSVFLPVLRDRLPDVLDLFDFAEPSLVTGDRETTNVPVQALYLMNSSFVQARSAALAERLANLSPHANQRLSLAFELCFGRPPDPAELKLAAQFIAIADAQAGKDPGLQGLSAYCQALFAAAEFRNLD